MSKPMNFRITSLGDSPENTGRFFLETNDGNYIIRKYFDADPDDDGVSVYDGNRKFLGQLSGFSISTQEDCENDSDAEKNMLELITAIQNEGW